MGKRDLEKLRREHKGKFSRTREPIKRESKEGASLLAETNLNSIQFCSSTWFS